MEIIILGLVLFILGVGGTMIYDKMKADGKSLTDYLPRVNQDDEMLKAFKRSQKQATQIPNPLPNNSLDKLLSEAKTRKANGQRTLTVRQGASQRTISVDELIKRIEQMKKNL